MRNVFSTILPAGWSAWATAQAYGWSYNSKSGCLVFGSRKTTPLGQDLDAGPIRVQSNEPLVAKASADSALLGVLVVTRSVTVTLHASRAAAAVEIRVITRSGPPRTTQLHVEFFDSQQRPLESITELDPDDAVQTVIYAGTAPVGHIQIHNADGGPEKFELVSVCRPIH